MKFKKPINVLLKEAAQEGTGTLKRTLSSTNLVALGIGAIIGAGLFSVTGLAAANNAGPAVTISFVIAAIACALAGLCYAEFASMIPIAGSAYTYSYATVGECAAWIIGWDLILEYALSATTVAISWSQYLVRFLHYFHIDIPIQLSMSFYESKTLVDGTTIHGWFNLPAVLIICGISLLLIKGISESAFINNLLVTLKISLVLIFIVLGWYYINPSNYHPFIPENIGETKLSRGEIGLLDFLSSKDFGHFGWSGILRGAGIVFFAYIGFDAISTAAQEAKNPKKGMPIGIIGSLLTCTVLYVLFSLVMTGMAHYTAFKDSATPVAIAIANTPHTWLQECIVLAILAGYTSVILVMLMGQSRIFFTMAKDGLIPKFFSDLHPKFNTPYKTNIVFAIFTGITAAFIPVDIVGEMVSMGTLLAFLLVCIGIILIRKSDPTIERPFKTPLVPFIPIAGAGVCFTMMAAMPAATWLRLAIWMALGLAIYYTYSKKHSVIRKQG